MPAGSFYNICRELYKLLMRRRFIFTAILLPMMLCLHILNVCALLFSSMGVTFNVHYCGGREVSRSVYASAPACDHAQEEVKACCAFRQHFAKSRKHDKGCCKDHSLYSSVKKENYDNHVVLKEIRPAAATVSFYTFIRPVCYGSVPDCFFSVPDIHPPPRTPDLVTELCVQRC